MKEGLVYVADFGGGLIKIGYTRKPRRRTTTLAKMYPEEIIQFYVTPRMPFAYRVEQVAVEWLLYQFPRRKGREWFDAPIEAAIDCVNRAARAYGWEDARKAEKMDPVIEFPGVCNKQIDS